jgi:hypothetical protein
VNPTEFPSILPVYPLEEPLLLPGTVAPFVVSEIWAFQLLEDAVRYGDSYLGFIQPLDGGRRLGVGRAGEPPFYTVGCLGRIGDCREEEPGEMLVLAEGLLRFRAVEELPAENGYRRMRVDYSEFLSDLSRNEDELGFPALREVIRSRLALNELALDLSVMDRMAGTEIVTAIAHAISFSPAERQFLLETRDLRELQDVLLQLMAGPGGTPRFDLPPMLPS